MKNILIIKGKNSVGGLAIWLKYLLSGFSSRNQKIHTIKPALSMLGSISKYDLIHIYEFSIYSLLITIIAQFNKVPILATIHADFIAGSEHLNPIRRFSIVSITRFCLKNATCITTPSTYLKNILHKIKVVDRERIIYIPNPVDLKHIGNIKPLPRQDNFRVVQITDFRYPQKARAVIDTIRTVRAINNHKIQLIIIGGRGYFSHFKNKYSSNNIIFKGLMSHNDSLKNIKSADIIVHTSYLDNAPISLLEAMACSKPITCYDIGGIKELVGNCAIVCHPKEFAKEFRFLFKNRKKKLELSKKSKLRSQLYSNKIISKRFESLYNSLIDG